MNKKVLNTLLTIIVVLIVIIFCAIYYYVTNNSAKNSIYDEVLFNNEPTSSNLEDTSALEENSDKANMSQVGKAFTGAFPHIDILPFIVEAGNITEFSNENILRLGFSKVTKEDWADSYQGEGEKVSIPASLLDGYIKDIFGANVQYQKTNFSNTEYSIDLDFKSHTNSYNAVYEADTDTYWIEHIVGDGINENHIEILEPMTSKIQDNVEVEYPYVFVVYGDEMITKEIAGENVSGFEYTIYAKCDYKTKAFSEELGKFSELDDGYDYNKKLTEIINANRDKVQKFSLIYSVDENTNTYVLKEIRK